MSHDYPSRNFITAYEKRFQELELRLQNMHRTGFVKEVKFDKEKKAWFAKMDDGAREGDNYQTDWLPWNTFSSGAIKSSIPPRVGQSVEFQSPAGNPENATLRAYHNNPDTPSPHDKEDQVFFRVEKPKEDGKPGDDKNKRIDFLITEDGSTITIGDTTHSMSKDTISHKTKTNSVETDTDKTKSKNHSLDTDSTKTNSKTHETNTDSRTVNAKTTTIKSGSYSLGGKVLINC